MSGQCTFSVFCSVSSTTSISGVCVILSPMTSPRTRLHVNSVAASDPGGITSTYSPMTDPDLQLPAKNDCPPVSSPPPTVDDMTYSHISVCRSQRMEIQIASPSVKAVRNEEHQTISLPVFGGNDRICGHVILDPTYHQSGHLSVSIEGTFQYVSPQIEATEDFSREPNKGRHVFFLATMAVPVVYDGAPARSPAFMREPSTQSRKQSSISSLRGIKNNGKESPLRFPFSFDIPPASQPGQKMPPTFSSAALVNSGTRGRAFVEKTEVNYGVTALWEPSYGYGDRALLEVPIIFEPENDSRSLNVTVAEPEFWLEIPLTSEREIPFRCAITLPSPGNFSRSASVPFYVVFTTTPKSLPLAREIAADATISVSLVRQVTVSAPSSSATSPPLTPSISEDGSSPSSPHQMFLSHKLFNRVAKSAPTLRARAPRTPVETATSNRDKPLPLVPSNEPTAFCDSRIIQTDVCAGFPKRPRNHRHQRESSTRMDPDGLLPDGLYKGEIQLDNAMIPNIDWYNISVKYYLDIFVIFRQDEIRARIPIRLY